ncbi:MAG TPA: bifunctional diaminohydroxyphosphoribosylaminopyrimidine deaminase/5-amino-6-(5-phosphoribosylamino)uracil reductase RibD [Alphaproteobacteria bacterium]|nr:bifunctional diaminohydroxyphosphoribosylaminopyrimidine deaminase/5-amino-6-(5-phosphoribosylamino)uracil reductase RibD [Alphaproteobacteria bacterium]
MRAALSLAARHLGQTWPNPAVGCVIVDAAGCVVGCGSTQPGGRPHAETQALGMAGARAKGGTAYVTLEPCAHHGKTPPCAAALMAAGIKRVVSAVEDPDPRVSGGGHAMLQAAGVTVQLGLLEAEARAANAGFLTRVGEGLPLVALKLATSADGRTATRAGESKWITGEAARAFGHRLRATHDAIAVGSGTVLADDPELTCRLPGLGHRSPQRVVFDRRGRTPPNAAVLRGARPTWLVTAPGMLKGRIQQPHEALEIEENGGPEAWLRLACRALAARGITRLLVEGGATLATAFLQADLVDRIYWFRAPLVIGGDGTAGIGPLNADRLTQALGFRRAGLRPLENDVLELYERPA